MAPGMAPGISLQMSQRLEMVMTPQMIQSMEMLQLPMLALEQRIQQELLENPALEMLDQLPEIEGLAAETEEAGEEGPDELREIDEANQDLRKVDEIDYDWDSSYDESAPRRNASGDDERFDLIENAAGRSLTFAEYLEEQLTYMDLLPRERRIVLQILYNLDPTGYLLIPLAESVMLDEDEEVPDEEELLEALRVVQRLDPPGVGARTVKECLLLQLDAIGGHPFERELVEKYLDDLGANRLPQIARSMGCTLEDVKRGAGMIRTLNPHPGLEYAPAPSSHVQPDVIIEIDENDQWDVRLVSGSQPEISDMFLAMFDTTKRGRQLREEILADPERAEEFKQMQALLKAGEQGKMLREKYQSARWLVTAIAQRERTLLRVSKEIVDAQKEYLGGQIDAPRPLMMQEVADRVGIDISTVSRAVRDKYMITPIGLKPLRMFFTRSVGGTTLGGKESSNVHIMNRIKEMIDAEEKRKPLKDDQIQVLLAKEGIEIKRRTVAKYRTNLGFPNHSQRREY